MMDVKAENVKDQLGLIVVDHGSRREESNQLLTDVVSQLAGIADIDIIEPAHMELVGPSIATAFDRCVQRGAKSVIVFPFLLSPGRHWHEDIPRLAAEAAQAHENVDFLVTAPLGIHSLMFQIILDRIEHCLSHAAGLAAECEWCAGTERCRFQSSH